MQVFHKKAFGFRKANILIKSSLLKGDNPMVNSIIIALAVICVIAILAIFALRTRRRLRGGRNKENGEKVPHFNCSIVSKSNSSDASNSGDVYDCVEDKGK